MLILASISIGMVADSGIINRARYGIEKYSEEEIYEQIKLVYTEWRTSKYIGSTEDDNDFIKKRLDKIYNNVKEVSVTENTLIVIFDVDGKDKVYYINVKKGTITLVKLISKSTKKEDSYVSYYADIDEDGTVDGVIFYDLLAVDTDESQPESTTSNVKNYFISQKNYNSVFGVKDVLSPIGKGGEDRFYVMSLNDFKSERKLKEDGTEEYPEYKTFYWYKNAFGKMNISDTSPNFGEGRKNTKKIIDIWNVNGETGGYTGATQDNQDIWKHIQEKYKEGWFMPSRDEWSAFISELNITKSNYSSKFKLSQSYWGSSQVNLNRANRIYLYNCSLIGSDVNRDYSVRLATTF